MPPGPIRFPWFFLMLVGPAVFVSLMIVVDARTHGLGRGGPDSMRSLGTALMAVLLALIPALFTAGLGATWAARRVAPPRSPIPMWLLAFAGYFLLNVILMFGGCVLGLSLV